MEKYSDEYLWFWESRTKKPSVKPNRFGAINDANFKVTRDKVAHPAYLCWSRMFNRVLSERQLKEKPTYRKVSICRDWYLFSNFLKWWRLNHVVGFQIDKDLLTDSKEYSPDSCVYVPSWLNNLVIDSASSRGEHSIGVSYHKRDKKFMSHISVDGKDIHLGNFDTEKEAASAYKEMKVNVINSKKKEIDMVDGRIYSRLLDIAC